MTGDRRLLVVTDSLSGGLGGAVLEQVEWFKTRGWEVRVAAGAHETEVRAADRDRRDSHSAHRSPVAGSPGSGAKPSTSVQGVAAFGHPLHGLRSFLVAALAGRRAIAHLHGSGHIPSNPDVFDPLRRAFLRVLPRLAVVAYSASPERARGWHFAPVASPRLASLELLPFPDHGGTPTFLWLGRLAEQKRADLFIDALAEAGKETQIRGVIAGTGPQEEELREHAKNVGAPVEFLGQQADIVPLLREAWAVVLLTRFEGMPFAVEEAMWTGRTIVGSRIPPLAVARRRRRHPRGHRRASG